MYYDIVKLDPVNNYFVLSEKELDNLKKTITKESLQRFASDMSVLFENPLESVTHKKTLPPSKNPNDYVSLATYFWPNPDTIDGLPYIQHDGNANPDGANYDKDKFRRLAYLVYHAGLLYFLTDDKKYYDLLSKHCYHWFINSETKMNPNLNFGQFIPGVVDGRAEGIIDYSANFAYALQLLTVLADKGLIEDELLNALKEWHLEFKTWLLESPIGKNENLAKNNHGTFYDFALLVIYQFLGDKEHVSSLAALFVETRIKPQILANGSMPLEIARTKSKSYTFMGLKGFMDFAKIMENDQIYLWDTPIKDAVNWLFDLTIIKNEWPYQQMTQFDEGIYISFMHQASQVYGNQFNRLNGIQPEKVINKVPYYLFV